MNRTMSVSKVNLFLNDIERLGVSRDRLIHEVELSGFGDLGTVTLAWPDNRIDEEALNQLFKTAAAMTQNESVGLFQGERLSKGFSNILGHLMMNCATLGEAAEKFEKYEQLMDTTSSLELVSDDTQVVFKIRTVSPVLKENRYLMDFRLAGLLTYMRILAGAGVVIPLKAVSFECDEPLDPSEYHRVFKCPVCFKASETKLVFEKKVLSIPLNDPNRDLIAPFERIAESQMAFQQVNVTYAQKVQSILSKEISGEVPSVEKVARQLTVSVRSLQGYLKQEGTTYLKLTNEVRRHMAQQHLKNRQTTLAEIAFVLGFSETSAFSRAFKKWTNLTPNEYRTRTGFFQ